MKWKIDASCLPSHYCVEVTGEVTVSEYIRVWQELFADPQWAPGSCVLLDIRKRIMDPTVAAEFREQLLDLFTVNRNITDHCNIAVLCDSGHHYTRQTFSYALKLRGFSVNLQYFHDKAAAEDWLLRVCHKATA